MEKDWREFEKLISRIEAALAPEGAKVESPDHIQDKVTGEMREVDAAIRYQIGTVPILITIECRDRSGIEDVTWIEQIATKRENIGAAKTIAVSSSGFTAPAIKLAELKGIEIRRISDITDEEIKKLIVWKGFVGRLFRAEIVDVGVHLDGEEPTTPVRVSTRVRALIKKGKFNAPVFCRCADGRFLSVVDFLEMMTGPQDFADVPDDGTRVRKTYRADFRGSRGTIELETGPADLKGVDITVEWFCEKTIMPIETFISYSDEQRQLFIAGEATTTIMGNDVVLTLLQKPGSSEGLTMGIHFGEPIN